MYNLRRMDLNLLTVLEALYIERNLTRAGDRVGLSQPAMSNALSRLRATFDDELFVRQGRTMQPTPKARQLADTTQRALDLMRDGLSAPSTFDTSMKRTFSFCGSEHSELVLLPLLAMRLGEDIRNISLRTVAARGDYLARLQSGEADLVVDYQVPDDPLLNSEKLVDDRLVCLIRKDHPFSKDKMELEDYASFRHVVPESAVNRFFLDNFLRSKGVSRSIAVRTNNVFAMPVIAEQTDMICTISELLSDVVADDFRFRKYPAPLPDPTFPLFMVWHKSRDADPGHIWIRELAKEVCTSLFDKSTPAPKQ